MDRWACVDLPELPLQLVLKDRPEWDGQPVVVVQEDRPEGLVLHANEAARRHRVLPGMRYAEALSLCTSAKAAERSPLHATVAGPEVVAEARNHVVDVLRTASPRVEPCGQEPGVFWLDATGLAGGQPESRSEGSTVSEGSTGTHKGPVAPGLYPNLRRWAEDVVMQLQKSGFVARVAVGFDRFATYALARAGRSTVLVSGDAAQEQDRARAMPLDRMGLAPRLREDLARLGITTVGGFQDLPPGGVLERFGADNYLLHRLSRGRLNATLQATAPVDPLSTRHDLDPELPGIDQQGLLFLIKQRLEILLQMLRRRGEAVASLDLRLWLEKGAHQDEHIAPADPTLDPAQLLDLMRLRLERVELLSQIEGFELSAEAAAVRREQRDLFAAPPVRDLRLANKALARLRAAFGEGSVRSAELRSGHLPEAHFRWLPCDTLRPARLSGGTPEHDPSVGLLRSFALLAGGDAGEIQEDARAEPCSPEQRPNLAERTLSPLVRRVFARPRVAHQQEPDEHGWCLGGMQHGAVTAMRGPYTVSGGWWVSEQHRDYHFAETRSGVVLWVFHDRRRRQWWIQGRVE